MGHQTTEEFIAKAKALWGEEYDYSQTVYHGAMRPIIIICRKHGPFKQHPYNHLRGHYCRQCKVDGQRMTGEEFVRRAKEMFPEYDYSGVEYRLAAVPVTIVCPVHGPFERRPAELLKGRGCPGCNCWRKPHPKRGPEFRKWQPGEIATLREVLVERRQRELAAMLGQRGTW